MQSNDRSSFPKRRFFTAEPTRNLLRAAPFLAAGPLLVFLVLQSSGCRHKPLCDELAAKNKACADAFDRYVQDKADQWNKAHPIPKGPQKSSATKTRPADSRTIGGSAPTGKAGQGSDQTKKRKVLSRAEAIKQMRRARIEAAKKGLRALFLGKDFITACRNAWTGSGKEDNRLKKAAKDCLSVSDCDAYVACIMNLKRHTNDSTLKPSE